MKFLVKLAAGDPAVRISLVILAATVLSLGLSAPALSAQQPESVRPVDTEISTLTQESERLKKAGQYDGAIAAARKAVQLAEGVDGPDSQRVGHFLTYVGSTYLSKGDRAGAEAAYKRAFAIFEQTYGQQLPGWSCYIPALLASLMNGRSAELDARIAYYERAVACYPARPKAGDANAAEAVYMLAHSYRIQRERADLVARAGPLLDRWIPIAERDLGPDRYEVARLMRVRGDVYAANGDAADARAMRVRALAVLSQGPGPAKGDKAKLEEEGQVLIALKDMYRGSNFDETYVGYQARYAAVLEQTEGPASRLTISARESLASLREEFPNWQPPGSVGSDPSVRQAALPTPAPGPARRGGAEIVQAPPGTGGKPVWPSGMEPGNLYFVIRADGEESGAWPIMVASSNGEEAVARLQRAHTQSLAKTISAGTVHPYRVMEGGQCSGPAWGAVVSNSVNKRWVWGGGCGKTPAQAIEAAFASCRKNGAADCETIGQYFWERPGISLALSGSTSWSGDYCENCFPSGQEHFGSFNAFTRNTFLDASYLLGMQDAIAKLGKPCDDSRPCYYTSTTVACYHETEVSIRAAKCTETRLRPEGYSGPLR